MKYKNNVYWLVVGLICFLFATFGYSDESVSKGNDLDADVQMIITAAEQGDAGAQFNLAVMYEDGTGVLQDDKQAVKWYTKAAEQGHANAQFNLVHCKY